MNAFDAGQRQKIIELQVFKLNGQMILCAFL